MDKFDDRAVRIVVASSCLVVAAVASTFAYQAGKLNGRIEAWTHVQTTLKQIIADREIKEV